MGYVLGAWVVKTSKCTMGCLLKLDMFQWVVGFEVFVSRLMFRGVWFLTSWNKCWATTETQHVSMSVCSRAPIACMWKLVSSYLEANDAFTTCCWNSVEGLVHMVGSKIHFVAMNIGVWIWVWLRFLSHLHPFNDFLGTNSKLHNCGIWIGILNFKLEVK